MNVLLIYTNEWSVGGHMVEEKEEEWRRGGGQAYSGLKERKAS